MPPSGGAAGSELPGSGLGHRHPLFPAPGRREGARLARGGGRHTQDHPGLPSGGEVCHAGGRRVHAQAGSEWDGDAEGQSRVGIGKHRRGEKGITAYFTINDVRELTDWGGGVELHMSIRT